MADEKTLFNSNTEKDDNSDTQSKQKHSMAKEDDLEFADFSLAFDGEDDEDSADVDEYEEEYEEPRRMPSLIKKLPFLRRKKDNNEEQITDEQVAEETKEDVSAVKDETEETEEVLTVKEESEEADKIKEESKIQVEDETEVSLDEAEEDEEKEPVLEQNPKKEKRFKGFSFFAKREKESVTPVAKETETEDVTEEQPIVEEITDEATEIPDAVEIELLPSFEESTPDVEDVIQTEENEPEIIEVVEEETESVTEETVTETKDAPIEETIEEIPPFESVVVETTEETVAETEDTPIEETIEEIPPFESTAVENDTAIPTEDTVVQAEEQPEIKKKKEKKQKAPKEKKEKKAKKVEESTDVQNENAPAEIMTVKDHLTFILIILALLLTIVFICVKFIPFGNNATQNTGNNAVVNENISEIQLQREGASGHCIRSDIENIFYMYSQEDVLAYYRCDNNKFIPVQPTGSVEATVDLGQDRLPVKIDYVQIDDELFGTGIFRAKDTEGNFLHSTVIFKVVNLPEGYKQEGKALLLATTNEEAISQYCNVWTDSYVVDLATGVTTRFLSSDNNIFSTGYSILTDEGYASTNGKIPFLTTREYDAVTNKKDIYLKDGKNETPFAKDVAGNFVCVDGDAICYLKSTDKGFNVIKKANGKESVVFAIPDDTSYMYYNEYLLDKYNGILYNVKTGEKTSVSGYGMVNAEMMAVCDNGRYLVVAGTVNSALDYQIHIFDLKKNDYAKYTDDNFSQHKNLAVVDKTTVVYSAVEPNQGYEYVILDVSKALK